MPEDDLSDMWRQAAHDRVGDEDPAAVMGLIAKGLPGVVRQPGRCKGLVQRLADRVIDTTRFCSPVRHWNSNTGAGTGSRKQTWGRFGRTRLSRTLTR